MSVLPTWLCCGWVLDGPKSNPSPLQHRSVSKNVWTKSCSLFIHRQRSAELELLLPKTIPSPLLQKKVFGFAQRKFSKIFLKHFVSMKWNILDWFLVFFTTFQIKVWASQCNMNLSARVLRRAHGLFKRYRARMTTTMMSQDRHLDPQGYHPILARACSVPVGQRLCSRLATTLGATINIIFFPFFLFFFLCRHLFS